MNNYSLKPGLILYNYAFDRCYLVLEKFISLPETWRCIYRGEDGFYRIYYISEDELRLTADGIWEVLPGVTIADAHLNAVIRGGENGFHVLRQIFDYARDQVMKIKYSNEKKENLADDSMKKFFGDLLMNENKKENT